MGRGLSIYLDLLRLLASIEVVLFHFAHVGARNPWHVWGHEAVVLFFVLSGFVIRHTAQTKDLTMKQFAASRLSRLYAAIVPCLILTMMFDYVGSAMAPEIYSHVDIPSDLRIAALKLYSSLFMLDQSWVVKSFYSNAAYWSVSYEFWFYVMFALSFYLNGRRRLLGFALVAVLAGPRVLLLAPLWLLGTVAYTERATRSFNRFAIWLGFAQPIAVLWMSTFFDLPQIGRGLLGGQAAWLGDASFVLSDLILALSLACHFAAAKQLDLPLSRLLGRAESMIRWGASRSFTLYLLHLPTMYLLAALSVTATGEAASWPMLIGTFAIPLLLAARIEGLRHVLLPLVRMVLERFCSAQPRAQASALLPKLK